MIAVKNTSNKTILKIAHAAVKAAAAINGWPRPVLEDYALIPTDEFIDELRYWLSIEGIGPTVPVPIVIHKPGTMLTRLNKRGRRKRNAKKEGATC